MTTYDAAYLANTNGAWRTRANPANADADPLIDYRADGGDGGREARPHGITLDQMTEADKVAYELAEVMADGKSLDEAKAPLQAFTTLVAPAGVAVENMSDDDRAFVAETNAKNKAIGDRALAVLMTGHWEGTPAPAVETQQPEAPQSEKPASTEGEAPAPNAPAAPAATSNDQADGASSDTPAKAPAAAAVPIAAANGASNGAGSDAHPAASGITLTPEAHAKAHSLLDTIKADAHLVSEKVRVAIAELEQLLHHPHHS